MRQNEKDIDRRRIELGARIQDVRIRSGMTRRQLADVCTFPIDRVRDVETGAQSRATTIARISDSLGMDTIGCLMSVSLVHPRVMHALLRNRRFAVAALELLDRIDAEDEETENG